MWYDQLNEKVMWAYFESLSQIPRESGNEEGVRQYLLAWAKEKGFEAVQDYIGNVVVYVPATPGRENEESICLQGHMDMVCVRTKESTHDFLTDPIEVVLDGANIRAKDTSLGADNGIAVAMIQALLDDEKFTHGPIEGLFTVNEEVGLTGAANLDPNIIKSKKLINLDSEEEGYIYIGCAGGIEIEASKAVNMKSVKPQMRAFEVVVKGLLGGHSGAEIHTQRANAIKIMARVFNRLPSYMIYKMDGGVRRNVIPSHCEVSFVVKSKYVEVVKSLFNSVKESIQAEYKIADPDLDITLTELKEVPELAVSKKQSRKWMESLYMAPCGVLRNSLVVPGVVETSNNVAIVNFDEENLKFNCINSTRSLVESAKEEAAYRVCAAFETNGSIVYLTDNYPSWQPDNNSVLVEDMAAAYKAFSGKDPVVTCIHAGLECGLINAKIKGMDSVSIGPNLYCVHSVNEYIDSSSAERFIGFMRYFLENNK